ncbi:MAG TPA: LexA family transcriptional regulator [Bacteroidales bacterium]|nr:LexA family transcriptional regulator [Bacteroidales bacterium]
MADNFFGQNIKLLRKRRGRTQDDVAGALDMKRPTLSGYENGVAEPGIEVLISFSDYYKISVDTLLKQDLSALPDSQLSQLERGFDIFVKGSTLRVMATTVDSSNRENIELVPHKASAGYRTGFADPEFIRMLPTFQLPFLSAERKYRMFQISGDSMLPIPDKSWITGEFVQNWQNIRDGLAYIILTIEDGILFKVIENHLNDEGRIRLHSLNPLYDPYYVDVKDIREIWRFIHYISAELPEPNLPKNEFAATLATLKKEVADIKSQLRQGKLFED